MTPERLAKIRAAFGLPGATWPTLELGRELLAHVDQLTAENSELQGAVDLCNHANKVYADDWNKAQEQVASLRQGVERLRGALVLAARWLGNGDATETFEDIGVWFRRDTGFLRPGKDEPLAVNSDQQARYDAWNSWTCETGDRVRETGRAALRETEGLVKP